MLLLSRLCSRSGVRGRVGSPAAVSSPRRLSTWPLDCCEGLLLSLHLSTPAPWWATIGGAAIGLRLAMLPSVAWQLRETRRFAALRPEFSRLRASLAHVQPPSKRVTTLVKAMHASCRRAGVQPLLVFGMPLVQIPLLLVVLLSVRRLVQSDKPEAATLRTGGLAWFRDLTSPDPYAILPLASFLLLIGNLQHSFAGSHSTLWLSVRNVLQAISTVMLPFYAELPSGIFMYWLPNSLFSLFQTAAIRRTSASRQLRGIDPPAALRAAQLASGESRSHFPASYVPSGGEPPPIHRGLPPISRSFNPPPAIEKEGGLNARAEEAPMPSEGLPTELAATLGVDSSSSQLTNSAVASESITQEEVKQGGEGEREKVEAAKNQAERGGDPGEEARGYMEKIAQNPHDVESHVKLSKILLARRQTEQAVAHLWPAVQAVPREHSGPLRFQLALALALQGQSDAAEPLLKQVLELEPEFPEAWICLSNCQQALGKLEEAADSLVRVSTLRPDIADWCTREAESLRSRSAS